MSFGYDRELRLCIQVLIFYKLGITSLVESIPLKRGLLQPTSHIALFFIMFSPSSPISHAKR